MKNATVRRDGKMILDTRRNREPCQVSSPNPLFLLTLALAFIATTGCTQPMDPMEVLIPADPTKWESDLFPHIERLNNVVNKLCVLKSLAMLEKGQLRHAPGLKVDHLRQVGCAMIEMESKISVKLVEKRDVREKEKYSGNTILVPIDFIVDIENTSETDILGLRAYFTFYNVFGRNVGSVSIYIEENFPAGSHKNMGSVRQGIGPFDKLLSGPNNEALGRLARGEYKYDLIVSAMALADGTKYEIPRALLP